MSESSAINWDCREVPLSQIKLLEQNPRTITKSAYSELSKSLQELGFADVFVLDHEYNCLHGNMRLMVMREQGVESAKCLIPDRALTEYEKKQIVIRKNTHAGSWDTDVLTANFDVDELLKGGLTLEELGIDLEDKPTQEKKKEKEVQCPNCEEIFKVKGHTV